MIREANFFDLPEILKIGKELYQEAITHNSLYEWDDNCAVMACKEYISSDNKLLLVDIKGSLITGFFAAQLASPLASKDIFAIDMMLFIRPEYQGSRTVFKFIKYYEKWAKEKGAKHIQLSVSSGLKQNRTLAMYSYLGYSPQSITYCKAV